jgi:hypothetical protein
MCILGCWRRRGELVRIGELISILSVLWPDRWLQEPGRGGGGVGFLKIEHVLRICLMLMLKAEHLRACDWSTVNFEDLHTPLSEDYDLEARMGCKIYLFYLY